MQAMPLNIVAAAPKNGGNAAAKTGSDTADAANQSPSSDGTNAFGAVLARQVNSQSNGQAQTPTSREGVQLADLAKLIEGKDGQAELNLQIDVGASQTVDPNAMAGLIAQALAALNKPDGQALPVKAAPDTASSQTSLQTAPDSTRQMLDVSEGAAMRVTAKRESDTAADFAEGGKVLPSADLLKHASDGHMSLDQLTTSFNDQLALAQQASASQPAKTDALSSAQLAASNSIDARVGAAGWSDGLGQKVVWMVGQQKQSAEIQLNPPNLGPLEVKLTVNQDQVSASFVSHHADVRNAIEAALPRLRDMLADSGITLGNVTVGAESFAQQQQQAQQQASSGQHGQAQNGPSFGSVFGADEAAADVQVTMTRIETNGLVNTFV